MRRYLEGKPFCCEVRFTLTHDQNIADLERSPSPLRRSLARTQICFAGKGPLSPNRLMFCHCKTVAYCSAECQKKDWKKHKVVCGGKLEEDGSVSSQALRVKKKGKGKKK